MDIATTIGSFSRLKVAVIGDVMLDTYWWGRVDRISPEAPVPIVVLGKKEYRIGGAGNVALNTASLGAITHVISVIGDDEDGRILTRLLQENNINTDGLITAPDRITTNKTRIMGRNQQMLRMDAEDTSELSAAREAAVLQYFRQLVASNKPDVVILEDYNKGVLTTGIIESVISICNEAGIYTTVDPKRKNFFAYKNATIFKPNLKEVKEALNLLSDSIEPEALTDIHLQLSAALQHDYSLITLSENGIFFFGKGAGNIIPTHKRNIADVSGAGDTVIAVASLVYAATQDIQLAAQVANIAGGLVCEEVGTVAINKAALEKECIKLLG